MKKRILFVGGSLNVTTMMHQISTHLGDHECAFTPFYVDRPLLAAMARRGLLNRTILGGAHSRQTRDYLARHSLPTDYGAANGRYHLVVSATDAVIPQNLSGIPMVLVQEGMIDPEDYRYHLVRALRLPRYIANTSTAGLSHAYTKFCVASAGFRDLFIRKGVNPDRVRVTGIPNFDNVAAFRRNDFPHRGYTLAITSCLRENLKYENRRAFIRRALRAAQGRPLIFKTHPNENQDRARREIEREAPDALIFHEGNTNAMVANADVLVTKYSSVALVAAALDKEIHSDLDPAWLNAVRPVQNGGISSQVIAAECREILS